MIAAESIQAEEYSFGPFRLVPNKRLLLEGETPVHLGSRAREILVALVEQAGAIVSKEELFARVWPATFIEESNLKVHVGALRRVLGDGQGANRYIATIPGRGYCFVAPVVSPSQPSYPDRNREPAARPQPLPAPLTRIVGRSDTIDLLVSRLLQHRFITIVGPGGIGKTTVALAVARTLSETYEHGARFVDLASITDPALVASALAAALGIAVRSENSIHRLVSFLKDKRILIVLDNCEHLIETAASLAEELFRGALRTHILATSREPLRAGGERVHRLAPLAAPPPSHRLTAAQALAFPAIQLFTERAAASLDSFELTDAEAPIVAELCRRLDGIALAIEIVASRVDAFGVAGLATRVDDRFRLRMSGPRTSHRRHQTLSTTLDWGYDLLPEAERAVLRGLAVFVGNFTWEAVSSVLELQNDENSSAFGVFANLIAKSLVTTNVEGKVPYYRLLETTRAYANLKLGESGKAGLLSRRHAEYYLQALRQAQVEWRLRPAVEWLEAHRHLIDNVRAALDWSFSAVGDPATAVALTAAAVPLWFQMSLVSECCERVERALATPLASSEADCELQLQAALAWSLMQTRGSVERTRAAWNALLKHAENLGDVDYQLRALWGLWTGLLNDAQLREALAVAHKFSDLAVRSADPSDKLVGDRLVGYIQHLMGEHTDARPRIERMLARYSAPIAGSKIIRFIFDQRVAARCFLARILWLQGFPDQAASAVEAALAEARARNDMFTLCQALLQAACPIAILTGDFEKLGPFVTLLLDYSVRNALGFWQTWAACFKGVHLIKAGEVKDGLAQLSGGLDALREMQYGVYYAVFLCEFAEALGQAGLPTQGLMAIDEALARSKRNDENWYIPEFLRVKGELLLKKGGKSAVADAEKHLQQSLALARRQAALSWELRTTTSLARLGRDLGHAKEAGDILRSVFDRFSEGFGSADLVAAKRMIEEA